MIKVCATVIKDSAVLQKEGSNHAWIRFFFAKFGYLYIYSG